ncbi:hypothetical protein BGZ82_007469 [Podila clonocystis]|nr:hypothetical protein BGZ82_007469 [Podila clonocystis]
MTQSDTLMTLQVVNVATYALRADFWGYFGILKKLPTRSVETESTSAFYAGRSRVQVFFPRKEIEHRQILLTSIPDAFGDWGGWFSVVYGVFYILFGSPRLDPFGLVALFFMTNKTKRKILKAYGPLPHQSPSPYGPDADTSRRMSNSSTMTSMSSYGTDSTTYSQMSPTTPSDYSKMASPNIPYQTQRMVDQRFRRLERMLSEYYLNMPTDDLQQEEEERDAGLIFYGYTKVRDVLSREFVLQITEMPRSSFNDIMSFPDTMMCSTGTRLRGSSSLVDVNNNNITVTMINITEVPQQMYHDLCNKHAWLTIFSTKNQLVNVTQNEDNVFNILLGFLPEVNAVTNIQTFVLRKDFWGLLGETEEVPKRSVSAVGSSFFRSGGSKVEIYMPKKEIHQKQIPDPTLYNHQMSPTYPGQHSPASLMSPGSEYFKPGEQLTQPQHQQVQRMMDSRFRRLERMLSDYYLEMPTIEDEVEAEKASQGAMGRFWDGIRGHRRQDHSSIPDNSSYYGPPLSGHDPYHDQVPLRAFDAKTMPRES